METEFFIRLSPQMNELEGCEDGLYSKYSPRPSFKISYFECTARRSLQNALI